MAEPERAADSPQIQEILINNSCGLSARIFSLLFSKEMSDVCLQVGAYTFELHKLILSASSDVFKAMLTNKTWPEAHGQPVVLIEEPQCESVFARFIEYIYSGELYLSHSSVCPLLTLADKYNVREMIPLCRAYMLKNLDAPVNQSCVLQWLKMAKLRNDTELETAIMGFVECNFSLVMQTSDFMAADLDIVVNILASSRLVVHNETMLLYATLLWLETFVESGHHSDESIKNVFQCVLGHLRWTMLTADEISCLQDCSVLRQFFQKYRQYCFAQQFPLYILQQHYLNENKDFLQSTSLCFTCGELSQKTNMCELKMYSYSGKLRSTMSYDYDHFCHSSCNKSSKCRNWNSEGDFKLPRIYINDYWCTALTISNFHAFPQYGTQTFLFSTPGISDSFSRNTLEWEVSILVYLLNFT